MGCNKRGDDVISGIADSKKCRQRSNHLTACFTFYLPNEMQFVDVTSAQLWFYKEYDENDDRNQTFVLSELDHWDLYGNFEKNMIMAIFETDIRGGSNQSFVYLISFKGHPVIYSPPFSFFLSYSIFSLKYLFYVHICNSNFCFRSKDRAELA